MEPASATNDGLLALSALEAAVAEARRRRQVVRWTGLTLALLTAIGFVLFVSTL